MVAGQDAESAAIDRKGLVQAKLGREIRDQAVCHLRVLACEPGAPPLHVIVECEKNAVVPAMKCGIGRGSSYPLSTYLAKHPHGVVGGQLPLGPIERFKQGARLRV